MCDLLSVLIVHDSADSGVSRCQKAEHSSTLAVSLDSIKHQCLNNCLTVPGKLASVYHTAGECLDLSVNAYKKGVGFKKSPGAREVVQWSNICCASVRTQVQVPELR